MPRSATVAQLFRSSTNAQCTCRVPIAELTHDKDWSSKSRIKQGTPRQLCLVPQRAVKQMTGYFGGYLAKRQKLGASDLKKSVAALAPAKRNCIRVNCARGEPHVRHFGRQGHSPGTRGKFMQSSRYDENDPLAAEFIHACWHQEFHDMFYVDYCDAAREIWI